jgi:predicted oxidoreductase (fatty acid repression mutant protein)
LSEESGPTIFFSDQANISGLREKFPIFQEYDRRFGADLRMCRESSV